MRTTLDQIKHENEAWRKMLEILQHENIILKNRLTDLLKLNIASDLLEKAEYFQNQFVFEDERIAYLRKNNKQLGMLLLQTLFEDETLLMEVSQKQKFLKKEIEMEQDGFNKVKSEFNEFADDILGRSEQQIA